MNPVYKTKNNMHELTKNQELRIRDLMQQAGANENFIWQCTQRTQIVGALYRNEANLVIEQLTVYINQVTAIHDKLNGQITAYLRQIAAYAPSLLLPDGEIDTQRFNYFLEKETPVGKPLDMQTLAELEQTRDLTARLLARYRAKST